MKELFLILSTTLLTNFSVIAQNCTQPTQNDDPKCHQKGGQANQENMNCCKTQEQTPKQSCCTNPNAANASTQNGNCPKPTTAKVKAVKAVAKPKED